MTVANNVTSIQRFGNGTATQFSFPNKIFTATDLAVTLVDLTGNQYTFTNFLNTTLGISYTISGVDVDTGCTVVFSAPIASGWTVDMRTRPTPLQLTSIKNQGAFFPELHEEAFDRLTRSVQDFARLSYTYGIHSLDNETIPWPALPPPSARKGMALVFDSATGLPTVSPLSSQAVTLGVIASFLSLTQTPAEASAGVTPANLQYQPYDIRRYGADPTGVLASDSALAQAIAVCGTLGGEIRAPAGKYSFASQINLNQKNAIVIRGDGGITTGSTSGTQFVYTGTGTGVWISMLSAIGCQLRDMQLVHTNAGFTGTYIKCGNDGTHGDPASCGTFGLVMGSSVNAVGNVHLDLDRCTFWTSERCNFLYGNPSVKGQNPAGSSYSRSNSFRDCQWTSSYVAPVNSQGESWTFENCVFLSLNNGAAGALVGATTATPTTALVVTGCWFGGITSSSPPGTWIDGCINGSLISGNSFLGSAASVTTAIALRQASGVAIIGCGFNALRNGVNFAVGSCNGIVVKGISATNVTNFWVNSAANVPIGQLDFEIGFGVPVPPGHGNTIQQGYRVHPDGTVEQWGLRTGLVNGGGNLVTFAINFPTACWNVQVSLSSVLATTATAYPSALTQSNFTITLQDPGATLDTAYWRAIGN